MLLFCCFFFGWGYLIRINGFQDHPLSVILRIHFISFPSIFFDLLLVSIDVFILIYIYIYIYIYKMYVHIWCVCVCIYIHICVCVCVCAYMCVCVHIYMCVCVCVHIYVCVCVCIYIYTCVCVWSCIWYKKREKLSNLCKGEGLFNYVNIVNISKMSNCFLLHFYPFHRKPTYSGEQSSCF